MKCIGRKSINLTFTSPSNKVIVNFWRTSTKLLIAQPLLRLILWVKKMFNRAPANSQFKAPNELPKPLRMLILIAATAFVIETVIMVLEHFFSYAPPFLLVFLDASLLTLGLIPILYQFLYKPMLLYIAEQSRLEREITRLDRLNLLGETAASIAHEIRNPMTTIRGFLQMLSQKQDCQPYWEHFDLMIQELDRANSIITEFLLMARSKALDFKWTNLNSIIQSLYPMILADANLSDKNVSLQLGNITNVYLDEKEIRQLLLNLCRNGLEAMQPRGTLYIKTLGQGDSVILQVQDQGSGIKADVLAKIGTPFFTTKKDGTGLGLAACYTIVARHNAVMQITDTPPGTTFSITFAKN